MAARLLAFARSAPLWAVWLLILTAPLAWIVPYKSTDPATRDQWLARFNAPRWEWLRENVGAEARENGGRWAARALALAALVAAVWAWNRPRFARARSGALDAALRRFPATARWSHRAFLLLLVLFLFAFPRISPLLFGGWTPGKKELDWMVQSSLYVVLALGLNIIVGMAGLLVLGYAAFYAIGAYTLGILAQQMGYFGLPDTHLNHWVAFPVAAAVAGLFGLALGLPSLRLRGDYLAIVTLGFGEAVRYLFKNWPALTGGEQGISIPRDCRIPPKWGEFPILEWSGGGFPWVSAGAVEPARKEELAYYLILAIAVITVFAIHRLNHSRLGRAFIALREDEVAAESMGIPTTRMKLLAFALSAVWGGIAGVFYAAYNGYVSPETFTFDESVLILSMVVLGGMGSTGGVILGAVLLYFIPVFLRDQYPAFQDYRKLIFGLLMVAMMIFRPQGLLGGRRRRIEMGDPEPTPATESPKSQV
ncbi:MAG: branched-chain amino acid ABC transporter permease [Planctomycetes bacterium]|nr:branched-chain amino acid ABC transporter permease [Planctomycetota bacterium]